MTRIKLKYVTADVDRYGTVRYYFRRRDQKQKIRLPGERGSAEFMAAYHALLEGRPLPTVHSPQIALTRAERDSMRWLCREYFQSHTFKTLDDKTQRRRRANLMAICGQPLSDQSQLQVGDAPFAEMPTKAVRRIRDGRETPAGANDWLKALKALFKWAVENEYCDRNPAKDVPKLKVVSAGWHTWTMEEVEQFEQTHPIGTTPRLALALLLYTGCRRSDVILFGPQHIKDGFLTYTQQKNRNRKPVTLELPVLPELRAVIDATETKHLTFLVSGHGKPYTVNGFGNRFRDWCDRAGLQHCTAHGLRKAGATRAAEHGATSAQLMAIYGWSDIKQAELYTRRASQKRIAGDSMHLITGKDRSGTNVSHFERGGDDSGTKIAKNGSKSEA